MDNLKYMIYNTSGPYWMIYEQDTNNPELYIRYDIEGIRIYKNKCVALQKAMELNNKC